MGPYKIIQATLTIYSGKSVPVDVEDKVFFEPIRKVKDKILDTFIGMCKDSDDPFVKIEVRTKELISWK